jgi:hypothetical protein
MTTTQHTIDAKIRHNEHDLLTRVVYQYAPQEFDGTPLLTVVDARVLTDEHYVPPKVNNWAQDWLDLDGYHRACEAAELERAQ